MKHAFKMIELTRAQKHMIDFTTRHGVALAHASSESSRMRTAEILVDYGLAELGFVRWDHGKRGKRSAFLRLTPRGLRFRRGTRSHTDPVFTYCGKRLNPRVVRT